MNKVVYTLLKTKKFNVEDLMNPDLIVFDQKIPHGVNSVDPHKNISLGSPNGRVSLLSQSEDF